MTSKLYNPDPGFGEFWFAGILVRGIGCGRVSRLIEGPRREVRAYLARAASTADYASIVSHSGG